MPIIEHRLRDSPPCSCCSEITRATTGIVDLGWDSAPLYFARWTPSRPEHGIALLIGIGDPRGFVAAKYEVDKNGIAIIGPDDYDWQMDSIKILERYEVINSPMVDKALQVIEEISTHDPNIHALINNIT